MPRLPVNLPIREHPHSKETRRLEIFSAVSDVNTSSLSFSYGSSAEGACRKSAREWDPSRRETYVISAEAKKRASAVTGGGASPLGAEVSGEKLWSAGKKSKCRYAAEI